MTYRMGERRTSNLVGGRKVSKGECVNYASAWSLRAFRQLTVQKTTCVVSLGIRRGVEGSLTMFIRSSRNSSSPLSPNARHCVKALKSVTMIRFVARLCSTPAMFYRQPMFNRLATNSVSHDRDDPINLYHPAQLSPKLQSENLGR